MIPIIGTKLKTARNHPSIENDALKVKTQEPWSFKSQVIFIFKCQMLSLFLMLDQLSRHSVQ